MFSSLVLGGPQRALSVFQQVVQPVGGGVRRDDPLGRGQALGFQGVPQLGGLGHVQMVALEPLGLDVYKRQGQAVAFLDGFAVLHALDKHHGGSLFTTDTKHRVPSLDTEMRQSAALWPRAPHRGRLRRKRGTGGGVRRRPASLSYHDCTVIAKRG